MTILFQVISSVIASFVCLTSNIFFAWPSSTVLLFSSKNTTLNRPMTEMEVSLFSSIYSISALISSTCSGYLLDKLGRKYTCMLFSFTQVDFRIFRLLWFVCFAQFMHPFMTEMFWHSVYSVYGLYVSLTSCVLLCPTLLAWIIVTFCYKVEAIIAAEFLGGLSGCMLLVAPVYISEFCQKSIRGTLASIPVIFSSMGLLISYLMGGYLAYETMNYTCLSMTVLEVMFLLLLKKSPVHLMSKGLEKEAAKVIAYYRGVETTSKVVQDEIEMIWKALNPELDDLTHEMKTQQPALENKPKMSAWKFFRKSRSTRQALMVAIVLFTCASFQGIAVVEVYAYPLFKSAVPTMSPIICSVISAVVTIVSALVSACLVEKAGRRSLVIYTSIASGLSCLILGTQIHLRWGPDWITPLFIYLFTFTYCCGIGNVSYVLNAEVFLPKIKGVASMIAMDWGMICNFIVLFIFNPIVTVIGLGPVFYIFTVVAFFTAIFCFFLLPETKGLTVDVIQNLFTKKRT